MVGIADSAYWRDLHATVVTEENDLGLDRFDHDDAWSLGTTMVSAARTRGLPVAVAIVFGEQRVFHAGLAGSSASNDDWLARKFRTVAKFNCSSWALTCLHRADDGDFFRDGGYDRARLALAGGAVPLRVRGSLIGAVGVSGLAEEDDHQFAIDSLRAWSADARAQ